MNVQHIELTEDRLLLKPIKSEECGIVLVKTQMQEAKEAMQAEVVAVGNGISLKTGAALSLDLHVSDRVLLAKHTGIVMRWNGEDLILSREKNVLAVIESDDAAV